MLIFFYSKMPFVLLFTFAEIISNTILINGYNIFAQFPGEKLLLKQEPRRVKQKANNIRDL